MILHLLNAEFNLELFRKRGIVEDHFPLHRFPALRSLSERWRDAGLGSFLQSFRRLTRPKDLRPYHGVAFYYGCPQAFYLAFTSIYVSWLVIVALIGVAFTVRAFVLHDSLDNFLTPIYALIITLWVTVVFERWKQRLE